jgi:hypothetical protein
MDVDNMKVKNKEQVRVRMVATPQIEYRYAYWDIYPYVYVDIIDIIPEKDRCDLETLFEEILLEYSDQQILEFDVVAVVETENFIKIQDRLNIELSKECLRLKDLVPVEVKTIEEFKGGE